MQNPDNFELKSGKCMCQHPDNLGITWRSMSLSGQFRNNMEVYVTIRTKFLSLIFNHLEVTFVSDIGNLSFQLAA